MKMPRSNLAIEIIFKHSFKNESNNAILKVAGGGSEVYFHFFLLFLIDTLVARDIRVCIHMSRSFDGCRWSRILSWTRIINLHNFKTYF